MDNPIPAERADTHGPSHSQVSRTSPIALPFRVTPLGNDFNGVGIGESTDLGRPPPPSRGVGHGPQREARVKPYLLSKPDRTAPPVKPHLHPCRRDAPLVPQYFPHHSGQDPVEIGPISCLVRCQHPQPNKTHGSTVMRKT